jgi:hypothetical protein
MLVERSAQQRFDYSLPADVQLLCSDVQLLQHGSREINVDAVDGFHHAPLVGEKAGNVFAPISPSGNRLRRD